MGETGCGKTRLVKYMCDLHTCNRKSCSYGLTDRDWDELKEKVKDKNVTKTHICERKDLKEEFPNGPWVQNMIIMKVL